MKFLQNKGGRIQFLRFQDIGETQSEGKSVYLGTDEVGQSYWAIDVSSDSEKLQRLVNEGTFVDTMPASLSLPHFEAALIAQARPMVDWNTRYVFCPACGSETKSVEAGHKRICKNQECIAHKGVQNFAYPRTDAVVIIAVKSMDGKKILLGRQSRWPALRYSCIAGFMECGESIEEACRREVMEESGVDVGSVSYHSSQPWPFPSQLMIGCIGQAKSESISLADKELEDAQWFEREEVLLALSNSSKIIKLPPPTAIAHKLIKTWAETQHPKI